MAPVLVFYEKKLRILHQRSQSDFIKMKYGELLRTRHISRIKPEAENPEQKWRITESVKCEFFRQLHYILLFLESLRFKLFHIGQSMLFMCSDPLYCNASN